MSKVIKIIVILIVIIMIVGIIRASFDNEVPEKVETISISTNEKVNTEINSTSKEIDVVDSTEVSTIFSVGDTAELNGVQVTLVSAIESNGSQFNTPANGNVFMICEFEIVNNSNIDFTISSLLSFEAYCDDYSVSYSLNAMIEKDGNNTLDGNVASGRKLNGFIGYEIPADYEELEIIFTPNIVSNDNFVFVIEGNK